MFVMSNDQGLNRGHCIYKHGSVRNQYIMSWLVYDGVLYQYAIEVCEGLAKGREMACKDHFHFFKLFVKKQHTLPQKPGRGSYRLTVPSGSCLVASIPHPPPIDGPLMYKYEYTARKFKASQQARTRRILDTATCRATLLPSNTVTIEVVRGYNIRSLHQVAITGIEQTLHEGMK